MSIEPTVLGERLRSHEKSIERNDSEIAKLSTELQAIQARAESIRRSLAFLASGRELRRAVDQTIVWRPGAMLIISTICGGVGLAVFRSPTLGIVGLIVGAVSTWTLLFYPSDNAAIETEKRLSIEQSDLKDRSSTLRIELGELKSIEQGLAARRKELEIELQQAQLEASSEYRRGLLLKENWRAMRSVEFEQFLERVFVELGYQVETTKVTGDQGVDLIVCQRGKRLAIQVKGYLASVSNSAIQEAHTGMVHYRCDACAAITNSLFTKSAIELASSVRCKLIDESSLPDLVLGKIDLWSVQMPTA